MVKKFTFLLMILLLFNNAYSYDYNESYTNLTIEQNGWCAGLTIDFKIYNGTEYDLYKNDDEYGFQNISDADVKLYAGPLDSLPLLLDQKPSKTGEFSYKFNESNQYLLEIFPNGKYNDFHEYIYVEECKNSNVEDVENYSPLKDKEFIYTDIKLILNDTNITSKEEITFEKIEDLESKGLPDLENVVKSVWIKGENNNFTNMDISFSLTSIEEDDNITAYHYKSQKWNKINHSRDANRIIIENIDYGIFAVSKSKIVEEPTIQNQTNQTLETNESSMTTQSEQEEAETQTEKTQNTNNNYVPPTKSNSSNNSLVILIGGIISLAAFLIIGVKISKKKKEEKTKIQEEHHAEPEALNSYNSVYDHVKDYVIKYKEQFSKDQIYRALSHANTPRDIIDKVFEEVYQ